MENIKAVVFDMDGVLLDTETICDRTWLMAARAMGLETETDFVNECRGMNERDMKAFLSRCFGAGFDAERFFSLSAGFFHGIETGEGIPLMPYARETLSYLSGRYEIALASSTCGDTVRRQLSAAGLLPYFRTLTTGDMVAHGKPDPEIYVAACASLGMAPASCLAVEDSPNGIRSAHGAGLHAVMVPDKIQPTEEIRNLCFRVVGSLHELTRFL